MQQTPFHMYYMARQLENLTEQDKWASIFHSSDLKIYPFQIAASDFVLRSPYLKGAILCDEAGLGKSHEAMLVVAQKCLECQNKILFVLPNADLIVQWIEVIEKYYFIPYVICSNKAEWEALITMDTQNPFEQEAILISTYDFVRLCDCTRGNSGTDIMGLGCF